MRADIYTQDKEKFMTIATSEIAPAMYAYFPCGDCGGTGVFEIDAHQCQDCGVCKGSGKEYISLY